MCVTISLPHRRFDAYVGVILSEDLANAGYSHIVCVTQRTYGNKRVCRNSARDKHCDKSG